MLRLLVKVFFIFIFFLSLLFGIKDFERVCDEEIAKKDFNISIIQSSCLKTAQYYEKIGDIENTLGYYLIANKLKNNFKYKHNIPKDKAGIYSNIAHSYMLIEQYTKAKIYYQKFLSSYHNPNPPIEKDFQELSKLYPQYQTQIRQARKIWNEIYKPFKELDMLYFKLDNLEPSQKSITILKKIILIKKKKIPYTLSLASDYQSLAILYEDYFTQYNTALILYGEMLNIFLKTLGENYFDTATAYYNIANIYNTKGEYNLALEIYQRVLNIDLKIFGEEHSETAATYHNMANTYTNIGKFKEAYKLYKKSLSIDFKVLKNKEHEHILATYHEMANLLSYEGEYDEALKLYFKILKVDERQNPKSIQLATLYHNIANAFKDKGEYHKALKYYNKSLKITILKLGEEHASTITTLHNIAFVYHYLGNYEKALKIYMQVLDIDLKIFGFNHPHTATTYHHIAYIYQDKKMYAESLELYNMALDIREKVLGKHHVSTASTYHNIANILEDLKAYKKALTLYNKALRIEIDILGEEHPTTANTYHNIANVLQSQKLYDKSIIYYQKALHANKKNLRKNHPTIAINYHNIGISYFYKKQYKEAFINTQKAFNIFLQNRKNNLYMLDIKEKEEYLLHNKGIIRITHLLKTSLFYQKEQTTKELFPQIFNYWLNYKGTLFEYQNILSMIKNNPKTSKETLEKINNLNLFTRQLANLKKQKEEDTNKIKNLVDNIHNIEIALSKSDQKFKTMLNIQEINTSQIAKELKPHQLYIDFVRGNNNYYVFTLDHQEHISFQQIDENRTQLIDQAIKSYRKNTEQMAQSIANHSIKEKVKSSKKEAKVILASLYNHLIKPYLQQYIKEKKHLIISPDGLLNLLPFEALYHQHKYLIEKYKISYISSGKELIRQRKMNFKTANTQMTIFANANFDALLKSPLYVTNDSTLAPSFEKQEEANIASILTKRFEVLGDAEVDIICQYYPSAKIYTDNNASVENLMQLRPSKILHLSTHGLFLQDKDIVNPMRKSLLIFAGGNQALRQGDKRGIISALKISTLDLRGTELVVLSACQSGVGKIQKAEGIIGLPKAFIQAGAKQVIMSLWTVSNQKTAQLMDYFYTSLSEKEDYTTALQTAKLKMIDQHPYYWSAFILSGI